MAGHGPPPKDPTTRARRNKPAEMRVITAVPTKQPALPVFEIARDDVLVEFVWPAATRDWWQMWADSPLSAEFTSTDWSYLLDTAVLHAQFWSGDTKVAGEIRLRSANFGATPADRARLKITFAAAEAAEESRGSRQSSRGRYDGLKLA